MMLFADLPYRIYDYVPDADLFDAYAAPHTVDYITGLSIRLHPQRTFVLGELTTVTYYAEVSSTGEYSTPVVRESFTYNRDPGSGLANSRTQVIEWYLSDGSIGPHPKNRGPKVYASIREKRDESTRKRRNQTSYASEVVIGVLMRVMPPLQALQQGQEYWKTLVHEVGLYEEGDTAPLKSRISGDDEPLWLNTVVNPQTGAALRDLILSELA